LQDVYLANSTGRNRLFRNNGDGTYESVETDTGTESSGNSTDAEWVAIHEGELPSLYVANWGVGNSFFINQGDGTFTEQAGVLGVRDPGNTTRAAWGNLLAPFVMSPALFIGRWDQQNMLYIPRVDDVGELDRYHETAHPLGMDQTAQTIDAEWIDFDDDGLLDLVVVMADGGIRLYHNQSYEVRVCE
jgi:hypothetical protein